MITYFGTFFTMLLKTCLYYYNVHIADYIKLHIYVISVELYTTESVKNKIMYLEQ